MRNLITETELHVEAQMARQATLCTVLLVEGDSDSRSLSAHTDKDRTYIAIGKSKSAVLKAARYFSEKRIDGIVALVDADIDNELGIDQRNELVVTTEHYDLEADFFFLPRMILRIINGFVDENQLRNVVPHPTFENAVQCVVRPAGIVGLVRFMSARDRLGLNLRGLPFVKLLSPEKGFDIEEAARIIHGRSETDLTVDEVASIVRRAEAEFNAEPKWCCGHDLADALSAAIFMWKRKKGVTREIVQDCLRVGVSDADFVRLKVYREIKRVVSLWGGLVWRVDAEAART